MNKEIDHEKTKELILKTRAMLEYSAKIFGNPPPKWCDEKLKYNIKGEVKSMSNLDGLHTKHTEEMILSPEDNQYTDCVKMNDSKTFVNNEDSSLSNINQFYMEEYAIDELWNILEHSFKVGDGFTEQFDVVRDNLLKVKDIEVLSKVQSQLNEIVEVYDDAIDKSIDADNEKHRQYYDKEYRRNIIVPMLVCQGERLYHNFVKYGTKVLIDRYDMMCSEGIDELYRDDMTLPNHMASLFRHGILDILLDKVD